MKKGLLYYRIPVHSPAWHKMRTTGLTDEEAVVFKMPAYGGGIGASEIATVLGVETKNRPVPQELFHWKVGSMVPPEFESIPAFHGIHLQDYVKDLWQCSDGSQKGFISVYNKWIASKGNQRNNVLLRRAQSVKAILINPDYPYLPINIDYWANSGTDCRSADHSIYAFGESIKGGFPLEIKTIGGMAAKATDYGISVPNVWQVNQQMLVTGARYAEIGLFELSDSRRFETYPFERNDEICNKIAVYGKRFWDNVLEGRKILAEIQAYNAEGNNSKDDFLMSCICSLEPEINEHEKFSEYCDDQYKKKEDFMPGSNDVYYLAKKQKFVMALIKKIEAIKTHVDNQLREVFRYERVGKMVFDDKNYIRYYRKAGQIHQIYNGIKYKPNDNDVQEEIEKINFF